MMGALEESAKFGTKLLETVDKFTSPWNKRRQSKAEQEADQKKIDMIRNNPDMEIVFVNGEMNARRRDPVALAERARQRELADSIRQQENLEDILELAAGEGEEQEEVSDKPVDEDWITRFFNIAKDINSEEMKIIWAKILAGEIKNPGCYSIRTLETLRNISKEEASVFSRISPYLLKLGKVKSLITRKEILEKHGINYDDLLTMDEAGLLNSSGFITQSISLTKEKPQRYLIGNTLLIIHTLKDSIELEIGIHPLTKTGIELSCVLARDEDKEYLRDVSNYICKENKNVYITLHAIISIKGDTINYSLKPYEEIGNKLSSAV